LGLSKLQHVEDYRDRSGISRSFEVFWRVVIARMRVRLSATTQEPLWILSDITIPLITIAGYIYLYKALGAPQVYSGFVLLGGIMVAFWANILWNMAAQFFWEKEMGNLEMYFVSPAPRMAVLLGMAFGSIVNTSLRSIAIIVVGAYVFHVSLDFANPLLTFGIFFESLIALYALGMLFASLFMLYGREAYHTANLFQDPVYFAGGFYFPILGAAYAPFWLQAAASIIPVTFALDAMRKLLVLGQGLNATWWDAAALAIFIAITLPVAKVLLAYMENLGRKEGRLTLRWQ
jgi:ABC-2 type transport system permease protein